MDRGEDGRPFAFLQDYDPHVWDAHHFGGPPAGGRGLDPFIGEPDMLGRGHGAGRIAQHVRALFDEGASGVGAGPLSD